MTRLHQRGFTLIELIIFIVIVGVGLTGILSVMNSVIKSSGDPMVNKQAITLAESVMEEIMLRAYDDPDPGVTKNEVSRADFDDVSDYNGKTQAVFTDLPIDLAGYNILIAVASAENFMGVAMKKVTVTVRRGSESVSLSSYRGKDGSS